MFFFSFFECILFIVSCLFFLVCALLARLLMIHASLQDDGGGDRMQDVPHTRQSGRGLGEVRSVSPKTNQVEQLRVVNVSSQR